MISEKKLPVEYFSHQDIEIIHTIVSKRWKEDGEPIPPFSTASQDNIDAFIKIPQSTYFGEEQYPSLTSKAAIIFYTLNKKHLFLNGNKRMSVACLSIFLHINGFDLVVPPDELTEKALWLASTTHTHDFSQIKSDLEIWIDTNLKKNILMNYWLLKTEPTSYSIDDLQKEKKTTWTGVRNYQARNFLRAMKKGDKVFIYHSSCEIPGLYGVGEVAIDALPDPTAFDKTDSHFDPKSTKEHPIWFAPTIIFKKKFLEPFSLFQIKADSELKNMMVAQQGSRLSVMPVDKEHFEKIVKKSK